MCIYKDNNILIILNSDFLIFKIFLDTIKNI